MSVPDSNRRRLKQDMKPHTDPDEKFEWDSTAVILLALVIVFLLFVVMSFAPFGHAT